MKATARKGRRRLDARAKTETYSLSEAKASLGRLADKSASGVTIYIKARGRRYLLQPVPEIEPIPIRPIGYFTYDEEDFELERKFAKVNVPARPDPE
jgi:hypothetical protein